MTNLEPLLAEFSLLYLRLVRVMNQRMAEEGASLARARMLLCLDRTGLKRGTELAEFFSLSPRTITEAIDGMERDGLVERQPDPDDRRAKIISITPAGHEALKRTEPLRLALIDQTFGTLEPEERENLMAYLRKIDAALDVMSPPDERCPVKPR